MRKLRVALLISIVFYTYSFVNQIAWNMGPVFFVFCCLSLGVLLRNEKV